MKVKESHLIYRNDYFELYEDVINIKQKEDSINNNNGNTCSNTKIFQRINIPNENVVILPIFPDGSLLMIEIYRHVVDKVLLELPAGTIEKNDTPIDTAKRELLEETGHSCKTLEYNGWYYTWPSKMNQKVHVFVATGLEKHSAQKLDETEEIKVKLVSKYELISMLNNNEISDARTLVAILYGYFVH